MIEDWGKIKVDQDRVWRDSVNELRKDLIRMNQEQLKAGFDAKGMKLPPYSSPYAKRKRIPLTPKTLNDTGEHYKGMYALVFDKFIEMGSRSKGDLLEYNWGEIYGLTPENEKEFTNLLIPIYARNLQKALLQ